MRGMRRSLQRRIGSLQRDRRAERTAISAIRRERARNTPDSEIAVIIAEDYEFPDDKVRELMARA